MRILLYRSKALSSSLAIEARLVHALDLFKKTSLLLIYLASMSLMFNTALALMQLELLLAIIFSFLGLAAFHLPWLGHKVALHLTFLIHFISLPYKAKSLHMTSILRFSTRLITLEYQMLRWEVL